MPFDSCSKLESSERQYLEYELSGQVHVGPLWLAKILIKRDPVMNRTMVFLSLRFPILSFKGTQDTDNRLQMFSALKTGTSFP